MTQTTRRYPRTLSGAFQRPPDRCTVLTGPYRKPRSALRRLVPWLAAVGIALFGILAARGFRL